MMVGCFSYAECCILYVVRVVVAWCMLFVVYCLLCGGVLSIACCVSSDMCC